MDIPQPIYSLTETKELAIKSKDTLVSDQGKYIRNDSLKGSKLVKISFDGNKDSIINIENN